MNEKSLACCVVRDLLPSYIEGLTEAETASMVEEHIGGCPDCRKIEQDMRSSIPVERTPKHELKFLRRIKRTRLIAALLSLILALWCIWWLYDSEFHYPNTEAGRLAAVEDYIPLPDDSSMTYGVKAGTPLHVGAWQETDGHLFVFYFADNAENVHGVLHLVRGINGKYRILEADMSPSQYSGGIYAENLTPVGMDRELYCIAAYNCRDIYRAELEFRGTDYNGTDRYGAVKTLELSGENALWLYDRKALEEELGFAGKGVIGFYMINMELYGRDGENITDEYLYTSVSSSWGSGKTTAETFLLYVYIGIVALLGIVFIRYFLRRD